MSLTRQSGAPARGNARGWATPEEASLVDPAAVLSVGQVASALGVAREYVRRIPGLRAGYPAAQVERELIRRGCTPRQAKEEIEKVLVTQRKPPADLSKEPLSGHNHRR